MPASTPAPGGLAQPLSDLFDAVPPDWREVTEPFRTSPVGQALIARVDAACRQGTTVYPADVFAALRHAAQQVARRLKRRHPARLGGQSPRHANVLQVDNLGCLCYHIRPDRIDFFNATPISLDIQERCKIQGWYQLPVEVMSEWLGPLCSLQALHLLTHTVHRWG